MRRSEHPVSRSIRHPVSMWELVLYTVAAVAVTMLIVIALMPFSLIVEVLVVPGVALVTLVAYLSIRGVAHAFRGVPSSEPAIAEAPAALSATPADYAVARHSDLLRNFTDGEAEAVLALAERTFLPEGMLVGEAGAQGTTLYMILDGSVELTGHTAKGAMTVRIAADGESFPLAVLLGAGNLVTSARAMTDVRALAIPRGRLLDYCAEHPSIGVKLFSTVAEILMGRYESILDRHLSAMDDLLKTPDLWANV